LSDTEVLVLGTDGNLWLEHGPFGKLPPPREQVEANVRDFQALSDTEVLVVGTDGNLWLEHGPFGRVPPPRQQVEANVLTFQALSDTEVLVLGTDGNLWLEQGPFGRVPPPRQQVDGNVAAFQALSDTEVLVLGTNGNLWLEHGPFGNVPPPRQQADGNVALNPPSPHSPSELSWTNLGTGSGTTSGGATKCSYTLNLTIQQNGTCRFRGSYTNRGDVPLITAPNQTFAVSIVVLDSNGIGYSFGVGGYIPSAPQPGSTYSWDRTEKSVAIAANWEAITRRNYAHWGYSNEASIADIFGEIGKAVQGVVQDIEAVAGTVSTVVAVVAAV
jgi:hypothetical protein